VQSNTLFLTWRVSCNDYDLLQTPSLNSPITWTSAVASVEVQSNLNVAAAPLLFDTDRFFRLALRSSGAIPMQPPRAPVLTYGDQDLTPIGATGITSVAYQQLPASVTLTVQLERQIRFAATQSPLVRNLLGPRFAYITTSPAELTKGGTNTAGVLQTLVTFFSHSSNAPVVVNMSGTNVLSATATSTDALNPPVGADEIAEALDLARSDPRLSGNVPGLLGTGLLAFLAPGQTGYGDRVVDVTFEMPTDPTPRYAAFVDLTTQSVLSVIPNP
jgi:hypothetical protein